MKLLIKKLTLILLLFLSLPAVAQNHQKLWDKVIGLESEDKIKSAYEIVEKIYSKASKQKNENQRIKCFFYKSKYLLILEEEAQNKIIKNLQDEIEQSSTPSKAFLNLVYAKCLTTYYNKYQYKLYQRTKIDSSKQKSISLWTASDFLTEIDYAYSQTLEKEHLLKSTPLKNYEPIFDYFSNEIINQTSLYDYLLRANIDYYTTKANKWNRIKNIPTTLQNNLLGTDLEFKKVIADSLNNEANSKVISLYQKATASATPTELELDRLLFCNTFICKNDAALVKSLNKLQRRTKDSFLLQKILYEKANLLNNGASKRLSPTNKIKAVAVLDSILTIENKSNTFKAASFKKNEITNKYVEVQLKEFTYAKENTRAFINYTNIDSIKISFYKASTDERLTTFSIDSISAVYRANHKPIASQKYILKNYKDYFTYSTEVVLPQLEIGHYWVIIEDLSLSSAPYYVIEKITVTSTALLAYQSSGKIIFQTVDRKTGAPLPNCEIKSDDFNLRTNNNGIAEHILDPKKKTTYYNLKEIVVIHEKDTLEVANTYLSDYLNGEDEESTYLRAKVDFYLDRGIYRPGQTVYYKGIATQSSNNKRRILPNFSLKVTIEDANGKEIKSYDTQTNEFGSFTGELLIPKNGITGEYSIKVEEPDHYEADALYDKIKDEHAIWDNGDMEYSQASFEVEEYKRPKFEVTFEASKESYVIDQTIKVAGLAKAFAGIPISNAKVVYHVERNTYYSWINYTNSSPTTLVSSETKTDEKGNFTIDFKALADEAIDKTKLPVFTYTISADITDQNGETRSGKTTVRVGYHALELEAKIQKLINPDKKNILSLNSKNLNNQFISTNGEVVLYYCSPFEPKFKRRDFPKPEIQVITDTEFDTLFPYEKNETKKDSIEKGTLLYSKKVNTGLEKTLPLDFMKDYKSGHYLVVFKALDKFNNLVQVETPFDIATKTKNNIPENCLFNIEQLNKNPYKDGFVSLRIDSVVPTLFLSCIGNYNASIFYDGQTELTDYHKTLTIPLPKLLNSNFKLVFETLFENQYFKMELPVFKLEEISKITFETSSFRDKLSPGQEENWSFSIKENNKKAEAEVLASMYDSSLDQFKKVEWYGLSQAINQYNSYQGKTSFGFGDTSIRINYPLLKAIPITLQNEYIKLMWFGFDFSNSKNALIAKEYKTQITKKAPKPLNAKLISGYVRDSSGPLPGASILVKGTSRSTQTDFDGYFEIEATQNELLLVSFTGYNSITVKVEQKNDTNIVLKEGMSLDEVVVVGYGTTTKERFTGTASKVKDNILSDSEDISSYSAAVVSALKGRIAGVTVEKNYAIADSSKIKGIESILKASASVSSNRPPLYILDGAIISEEDFMALDPKSIVDVQFLKNQNDISIYGSKGANGVIVLTSHKALEELTQLKPRTNRNETAFFYPQLRTNKEGKVNFQFKTPEELTQWKLRLLAHTKDAKSGYLERSVVTQKELMVFPNMPRFLRENDTIVLTTKIANLSQTMKKGLAVLQLFDAATMQNIDRKTNNESAIRNFTINPSGSTTVSWKISIPKGLQGLDYKVIAKADNYSDGEENIVPVLSNRLLVTESIPIWVREKSEKEYVFPNLQNTNSSTLQNQLFTIEYTSNPAWLAIQSLPYLMEYEHDCAEQLFSKYYSNVLAAEIITSNPKIAAVFWEWRKAGKCFSKLEQNESLKAIILAETPWALDAQNEKDQQNKLATLFDLEQARTNTASLFQKLKAQQKPSGGFAWFEGGDENEYISRHILTGLGHLKKLNVNQDLSKHFVEITKLGLAFTDAKFLSHFKVANDNRRSSYLHDDLHYLYMRSFYLEDYPLSEQLSLQFNKQIQIIKNEWQSFSIFNKGIASLLLYRYGEKNTAKKILEGLKETAANNEDWGMYWIENKAGWHWYESPIETQALLIEAFSEVNNDTNSVDAMKVWLLKNKQTKNWSTTKATTEAIYALLLKGSDWLSVKDNTKIKFRNTTIQTAKLAASAKEAEVGYSKLRWQASEINKDMSKITIDNKSTMSCYGGIYWQYFENSDKIKSNNMGLLSVTKELYLKKSTLNGMLLTPISSSNPLKIGDLITVKLIIQAKEDVDFIHLKDLRAACFEPINVLSHFEWKDNLGYYISTKDAATHFFFDHINKGAYSIEYDLRINNNGDFSDGITTIESMYAPEYTSHTKGIRLKVSE